MLYANKCAQLRISQTALILPLQSLLRTKVTSGSLRGADLGPFSRRSAMSLVEVGRKLTVLSKL